jgi:hypothetical protein
MNIFETKDEGEEEKKTEKKEGKERRSEEKETSTNIKRWGTEPWQCAVYNSARDCGRKKTENVHARHCLMESWSHGPA